MITRNFLPFKFCNLSFRLLNNKIILKIIGEKKYLIFISTILLSCDISAQPTISGFSPTSGPVGTTVNIIGTNFDPISTNDIVYFGAVRAIVISASVTSISVVVPVGSSYAPITETVNNLTAYSALP